MNDPIAIRHVDLRGEEPAVATGGSSFTIFWWGDLPLGARMACSEQLPYGEGQLGALTAEFLAEQLAAREPELGAPLRATVAGDPKPALSLAAARNLDRPLARIERLAEPGAGDPGLVSVILCTRDRLAGLATCLASLRNQIGQPGEILVVDNSASGSARAMCADRPGIVYVHEPRPGLSIARNAGVRAARRDILAFTDDDVEVHPRWTSEVASAFADPRVEAMAGLVLPAELATPAQCYFQFELGGFGSRFVPSLFDQQYFAEARTRGAQVWQIGAGANMAFRRSAFDRAGLFDERLGAGASGCSEDSELWYRLFARGGNCLYEPRAVVFHHHRAEWAALKAQQRSYMRGHVSALVAQYDAFGDRANLRGIWRRLPKYLYRSLKSGLRHRDRRAMAVAQIIGWTSGLQYLFRRGWRAKGVQRS